MAAAPVSLGVEEAYQLAIGFAAPGRDRFYGPVGEAAIGAGLVLTNVDYPTFLADEGRFGILNGPVLVLTHECDLDPENERMMNDHALVCPIISLEAFVENLGLVEYERAKRFVANTSARYVNRLMYLPTIPDTLPRGGYLYLNLLTNTHISRLQAAGTEQICMLSGDGFRELDIALERHLRRPKADRMPLEFGAEKA